MLNADQKKILLNAMHNCQGTNTYLDANLIAGFSCIKETNWKIGILMNYEKIIGPANKISDSIKDMNKEFEKDINSKIQMTILIVLIFLTIAVFAVFLVSRKVTDLIANPIKILDEGAHIIGAGDLNHKIVVNTNDELDDLAGSFNTMATNLKDHIEKVTQVTTDRERIKTELNVATTIQESMLPCVFPALPHRSDIDIHASMHPAKEVGGDFYDFFMLDENTLAFVIADVSGKGVSAALFMVIAKTLLKDHAQSGLTPSQVLEIVNNRLCESNGAGMFLTAFLGFVDLQTGKLTFANAGHNPPLIYRKGKGYEWLKTKPKFILAGFPDVKYKDEEDVLNKGDKIYLYTDGVTEALNPAAELYSDPRLLDALNEQGVGEKNPKETLEHMSQSIKTFVNGAEQSDDITMMLIELK
jgi:sigma-B regulation protein RsbU (phosphoserine phosphatase)